jgi:uncharacterized membrane protein YdbT with pleckstrin-like domain
MLQGATVTEPFSNNPRDRDRGDSYTPTGEERPIWSGTPSQWTNFPAFIITLIVVVASIVAAVKMQQPYIAAVAGAAVLLAFIPWLRVRTTQIEVTSERIGTRTGIFTRRRRDMELYRVKDTTLHEPFFLRLVGLANIEVVSSDKTTPFLILPAIRDAESLRQQIRSNVERMRMSRRVRELDFE